MYICIFFSCHQTKVHAVVEVEEGVFRVNVDEEGVVEGGLTEGVEGAGKLFYNLFYFVCLLLMHHVFF